MQHHIIEIKARSGEASLIRTILQEKNATFKGKDHQIDTYFNCQHGRLKLREGKIESALIHYFRPNQEGPKRSDVLLYKSPIPNDLKTVLTAALGIKVVVDKEREIYFIDNVKFHIDTVKNLGSFVEIEAIAPEKDTPEAFLLEQCKHYLALFGIDDNDLMSNSYSDMMVARDG